jgi:glycosyltransferase involved in cell wall biosynthesis
MPLSYDSIILIAYHFHPSGEIGARRVTKLARFLAAEGFRVFVVSPFAGANIPGGGEIFPGVIAVPVPQPETLLLHRLVKIKHKIGQAIDAVPRNSFASDLQAGNPTTTKRRRLRSAIKSAIFRCMFFVDPFKRWAWHASRAAVHVGRKHRTTLVITSSPPNSAHLAGRRVASKLKIPHVADFRDPWVDAHPDLKLSRPSLSVRLTTLVERSVVRDAAAVTCTAPTLIERFAERYRLPVAKLHLIRNGFDGPVAPPAQSSHMLNVLYAGEIYMNRDPFPFLSAVENLLENPEVDPARVKVTFVGNCQSYNDLPLAKWLQNKRSRSVVSVLPPVPLSALEKLVQDATVLLNLTQNAPLMVPAKTYDQIASGREILLICENNSDAALMLQGMRGVTRVDPADQTALNAALWDLYRRHVVAGVINSPLPSEVGRFSRETANRKFLAIMTSVTAGRG